jgi:hypothetical protein
MRDGVVVGAGAGFAGDRIEPAVALAASGRCDAVILECLAERTLVAGLDARAVDADTGYDPRLRRRLSPLLGPARENGCTIVTNLGSANPQAAAEAIGALATELGIRGLRVAAVTGDDLMGSPELVRWEEPVDGRLRGAHAYLGAAAIREAVDAGADVVVTGRVADASLFLGPAWSSLVADAAAVAGATAIGHLLECSAQVTGGNLDAPDPEGREDRLAGLELTDIGYPLAHIGPDGGATITKLDGTGGRIDALTCTLQLLYEVHDPHAYITPDAVVDMSAVRFEQTGPDQVAVTGARSVGVPDQLKVVGFAGGDSTIADLEISYAGRRALERATCAADILRSRLAREPGVEAVQVDLVGVDSVLRGSTRRPPSPPPELRVHASVRCADDATALIAEDEVFGLTLTGPGGGCCLRSERRRHLETITGWVHREDVTPVISWVVSR